MDTNGRKNINLEIKRISLAALNELRPIVSKDDGQDASDNNSSAESVKTMMFKFAYWDDYYETIRELKNKTLDEDSWDFGDGSCVILDNYLCNTFCQILSENKIFFQDNWAIFNTGLLNKYYEIIYCVLQANNNKGKQKWIYYDFLSGGEKSKKGNNITLSNFSQLPEKARYYNKFTDLYYDSDKELSSDYKHIIEKSIDRFPVYIKEKLFPSGIIDTEDMRGRFETAINRLKNRLKINYRTAVPFYYVKGKVIQFLLPICLLDYNKADLALVVSTREGGYHGETIYPLEWAYSYARLLCKPDNDWLNIERVKEILNYK